MDIRLVCLVLLLVPLPLHFREIRQNITDNPCLEHQAWALIVSKNKAFKMIVLASFELFFLVFDFVSNSLKWLDGVSPEK